MNRQESEEWIAPYREAIAAFCEKWQITEFALFGSVLRDDFGPESDIDVLVSFVPEARWHLIHLIDMEDQLAMMFGRKVDLVERKGVEKSPSKIIRKSILNSAEVIYVP